MSSQLHLLPRGTPNTRPHESVPKHVQKKTAGFKFLSVMDNALGTKMKSEWKRVAKKNHITHLVTCEAALRRGVSP